MNLVIDANIIFAALIKESKSDELIFSYDFNLFSPEFFFDELKEHEEEILNKSQRSKEEFYRLIEILTKRIVLVPLDEIHCFLQKAEEISPDPDDVAYIALALKLNCAIWSNDKELKEKQDSINVYSTEDLIRMFY